MALSLVQLSFDLAIRFMNDTDREFGIIEHPDPETLVSDLINGTRTAIGIEEVTYKQIKKIITLVAKRIKEARIGDAILVQLIGDKIQFERVPEGVYEVYQEVIHEVLAFAKTAVSGDSKILFAGNQGPIDQSLMNLLIALTPAGYRIELEQSLDREPGFQPSFPKTDLYDVRFPGLTGVSVRKI